jgi:hypothetical protein
MSGVKFAMRKAPFDLVSFYPHHHDCKKGADGLAASAHKKTGHWTYVQ